MGFPDDFVDGVFFADGIHHLADEKFEAAAFVGVDGVGDDDLIVEVFEDFLLLEGLFVSICAFWGEGDDFESVAGDVFLALAGDGFDEIVAVLNNFPHERGIADIAAVEFVVGVGQIIRRNIFCWIKAITYRQRNSLSR